METPRVIIRVVDGKIAEIRSNTTIVSVAVIDLEKEATVSDERFYPIMGSALDDWENMAYTLTKIEHQLN